MDTYERLEHAFDLRGTPVNTRKTYARCIGKFERFAGRCANTLERPDVERFLLHLVHECRVSPSTHNVYVGALRFLYDVVLERPEVMHRVPRRKRPMRLPVLLSAEDVVRLLAAVRSITVRTILMLAYGAGLRVSEACALRVDDIDSGRMVLHIRHAKRGRERYVMLSPRLLDALRTYWRAQRPVGPALFQGRGRAAPISRDAASKATSVAARRCGITRRVTPHTLRHGFATALLEQGWTCVPCRYRWRRPAGWQSGWRAYCLRTTSTSSLPCRRPGEPWRVETGDRSSACCSLPRPKRFSSLAATPSGSARSSASLRSCIPGRESWSSIPTCIVS